MAKRFIGSGRLKEGGFLAVHKQDFNVHYRGEDFRHGAPDIDMEPPLTVLDNAFYHVNVQGTLELLADYLSKLGLGDFVSIGTVDNPGDFNVDTTDYPTLKDAFDGAVAHDTLLNGGWILVKAGKYSTSQTITIPGGISVMGEVAGTIIVGETAELPMFTISESTDTTTIGGDSGGGELDLEIGSPVDSCKFVNLILADNLDGNITSGGDPIATMTLVPMIQCEVGSGFTCDYVKFIGRVNYGAVNSRDKTFRAINYTGVSARASHLTMRNCFFDAMQIAVDFSPGNDDIDFLQMDHCRARTFGNEDPMALDPDKNCFVSFSLCNATLTNNYHLGIDSGADSSVRFCYYLSSVGGGGTDVRLVMTGNTGNPSANLTMDKSAFFVNVVEDVIAVQTGNNWGNTVHNDWYVIVGGDTIDFPSGDFFGPDAIDLLLNINVAYPTTVIVNAGTYSVTTGVGGKNYNFIGNKVNSTDYPIFSLNITSAATDSVGNRFFDVGSYIKSIRFETDQAISSNYHSVHVNHGGNSSVLVDDCCFKDCALYVPPLPAAVPTQRKSIIVNDCYFYKEPGVVPWTDNISMLLPTADEVLVQGCVFRGRGYVGGIGQVAAIGYVNGSSYTAANIVVRNCTMNLDGESITDQSPVTDHDYYFFVDDNSDNVNLFIEDCQMSVTSDFTSFSPIALPLAVLDDFDKFVYLLARDITVVNSLVNGPDQTFLDAASGDDFVMPSMYIEPLQRCVVSDCRFLNGIFPLQIGGPQAFQDNTYSGGISVLNNDFVVRGGLGAGLNLTLLDIDIDPRADLSTNDFSPTVNISQNNFTSFNGPGAGIKLKLPYHTEATSYYTGIGVVQVYAGQFNVNFSENEVICNGFGEMDATTLTGVVANYSGVYIDNYNGDLVTGVSMSPVNVSNNKISVVNVDGGAGAGPPDRIECLIVIASVLSIQDNVLNMQNDEGLGSGAIGINVLLIDNIPTNDAETYSEGMVCGNIFSRRSRTTHALVPLQEGYVVMTAASGSGWLKDNSFDSPFWDAAVAGDEALILDLSSSWISERNKNQTETFICSIYNGHWGSGENDNAPLGGFIFGDSESAGVPASMNSLFSRVQLTSVVNLVANSDVPSILNVSNIAREFWWGLSLSEVLPKNTYVVEATQDNIGWIATVAGDVLNVNFKLGAQGEPLLTDSAVLFAPAFPGVAFGNVLITGSPDYKVNDSDKLYLVLHLSLRGIAPGEAILFTTSGFVQIKYRWL